MINRYTVPFEAKVEEDWFDEYGFAAPERIRDKQSVRDLLAEGVVIAAGEPWTGKTHVFNHLVEDLRNRERYVGRLSLEDGDQAAEPVWWSHWKSSSREAWWLIDAVDEALHVGSASISDVLRPALALASERSRLHLIIFTRDDDSLALLRDGLKAGGYSPTLRRLLPFDRSEAQRIVGGGTAFRLALEHLGDPSLRGLARFQPVLRALAGTSPHRSKVAVLQDAVEALCCEHFGRRRERLETLSKPHAFQAASRLAAVLLLSDRTTAQLDHGVGQVPLRDVFPQQPLLLSAAERLRGSLLFRKTSDGHRFRQRFVMELLAGFCLKDLNPEALRLLTRGNAASFPARLGALERTLRDLNASALSDPLSEVTSVETRRTLAWATSKVDALIAAVGSARWFPRQREDLLTLLDAPGIHDVLDSRLADKQLPAQARELVFQVAIAIAAKSIVGRAIQIALDVDESHDLRTTATYFATRFGDATQVDALRPLLEAQQVSPPARAVARVLDVLVSLGAMDPLAAATLAPTPTRHVYDARAAALATIEKSLTLVHARILIDEWLSATPSSKASADLPRDRLRKRAASLLLAAPSLFSEDVRRLAGLIRIDSLHRIVDPRALDAKLGSDPVLRRELYRELLGHKERWRVGFALLPEDAQWMMEMTLAQPDGRLIDDLYGLTHRLSVDHPQRVAVTDFIERRFPEHAARLESARRESESQRLEFERQLNAERSESTPVPIAGLVTDLLAAPIDSSEVLRRLGLVCFTDAPFRPDDVSGTFADLSPELQDQAIFRVRACLQSAVPHPLPAAEDSEFSTALVFEAFAFRAALTFDADRSWLSPSIVARWLPGSLFALPDDVPIIVSELLRLSPETTRDLALQAVERELSSRAHAGLLHRLPVEAWSDSFCVRIADLLLGTHGVALEKRCDALRVLASRSASYGARCARQLMLDGTAERGMKVVAGDVLLAIQPAEVEWTHLAPLIDTTDDVERMRGLLGGLGGEPRVSLNELPALVLADLAEKLWKLYPRSGDPDRLGPRCVGPDDHAREARDELLKALLDRSRASREAAAAVERLAAADQWFADWASAMQADAAVSAVLDSMSPEPTVPSVAEVVRVLDDAAFRPIRSERDLWRLTVEVLRTAVGSSVGHDVDLLYDLDRRGAKHDKAGPNEAKLQAYIRRRLEDLLPRYNDSVTLKPLVIREAQEKFRRRCDILVVAPLAAGLATVAVEIKWSHDRRCERALTDQLVQHYLLQHGRTHGVYLVGWSGTPRPATWNGRVSRIAEHAERALEAHPDLCVVPLYLECPWTDAQVESREPPRSEPPRGKPGRRVRSKRRPSS